MWVRVAVGIGGLAVVLACGPPPSSVGVVVVRASPGIDARAEAGLAEQIAVAVRELGFAVTVDPEPLDAADPLDAARARAAEVGAAQALVLTPSSEELREGVVAGTHLYRVSMRIDAVNHDEAIPVASHTVAFASEAFAPAEVERGMSDGWAEALPAWAGGALFAAPDLERALAFDVPVEELEHARRLKEMSLAVSLARDRLAERDATCADERAALEAAGCFGDPCGGTSVLGVDPAGRVIVQDSHRDLFVPIPPPEVAHWTEPPERILAIPLADPTAAVPLVESGNLFGLGAVWPGAAVGGVELFGADGVNAIYGFDLSDGTRRALVVLAEDERTTFSRVAPDGSGVLACLRTGECWFSDGAGRHPLPPMAFGELVTLGGRVVVAGGSVDGLVVGPPDAVAVVRPPAPVAAILGVRGPTLWLETHDEGVCGRFGYGPDGIVRGGEMPCLESATLLPDGRVVGIEPWRGDTPRVVVWDPDTGVETPLHRRGDWSVDRPFPTADGRVVYNRQLAPLPRALDTQIYRRVVCVADVPPR